MNAVQRFERNTAGRDFAVGDIHGCFERLQYELDSIGFDETRDRLFSVGDLVDRGPSSEDAIDWIAKPWFHAVRGNHEQMAIGVAAGRHDMVNYLANGGGWFLALPDARQQLTAQMFETLPYAIEIDTSRGRFGIVHADIDGSSWNEFVAALADADSNNKRRRLTEICLWSRSRIMDANQGRSTTRIHDLEKLIVGHTPMENVTLVENVYYIDTGCVFGGKLTVIQIDGPVCTRS